MSRAYMNLSISQKITVNSDASEPESNVAVTGLEWL